MPASKIRSDYDQLNQIAARFGCQAERSQESLILLRKRLQVLEGGDWVGKGASKFYSEMNGQVLPSVDRLAKALSQAANTTRRINAVMKQAESDAAALFKGAEVPGRLGAMAAGLMGGNGGGGSAQPVRASNVDLGIALKEKVLKSARVDGEVFVDDDGNVTDSDNAINPNDIYQGAIGDCYLLVSLAAVARRKPSLIRNMIKANPDGSYTVTFKKESLIPGIYKDVSVNVQPDFLVGEGGVRAPVAHVGDFANNGKPEIWVPIIEKAYAKLNGGYANIDGGFDSKVVPMLTGTRTDSHKPSDLAFEDFEEKFKAGSAITVDTLPKSALSTVDQAIIDSEILRESDAAKWSESLYASGRLAPNHAYTIVGVNKTTQTVMLQNPWGWSDIPLTVPYSQLQPSLQSININDGTQPTIGEAAQSGINRAKSQGQTQ